MDGLVSKTKLEEVNLRLARLGVSEDDLREEFIKGSGSGGQKINKTSSCVQLFHEKSGIVVRCQESRSRELNRFLARRILAEKLEQIIFKKDSEKEKLIRKIRAQKKKRSRRAKEKMLQGKKHHAEIKSGRKRPNW